MAKKIRKPLPKYRRIPMWMGAIVPVTITANKQGQTAVHPDPAHVSKKGKDEVKWEGAKDFTIDFNGPNGSPFASSHFAGGPGHPAYSGRVTGDPNKDYKYTAEISGAAPKDPIIHTDP